MTRIPLDGEIRDGRHFLTVRVYYEDTELCQRIDANLELAAISVNWCEHGKVWL